MIKAVLLDLDDTLLYNSDKRFVPAYLEAIEMFFTSQTGFSGVQQAVMGSLSAMTGSSDPNQTNTEAAIAFISAVLGCTATELQPHFDVFYSQTFPRLQPITAPVDAATPLVEALQTMGLKVVIATNPVYPAVAVYHRLAWAGLPTDPAAYALVTHGDDMHFIKPNPAYYAEILAKIGVEPEEAVMVGNSATHDIAPAAQMGLHTYHVVMMDETPHSLASAAGTLGAFLADVRDGWLGTLASRPLTHTMIIPELTANVAALFSQLSAVTPTQWTAHPVAGEWSVLQIVCHLLNREAGVHRARLQQIHREDNPFISIPPPDDPYEEGCEEDGLRIAHAFAAQRQQTIAFLQSLPLEAWDAPARHSIFSNTTLLEMAHFAAQHDRMHLTQLRQTLHLA